MKIQLLYSDDSYLPEVTYLCNLFNSILQTRLTPCHFLHYNQENPCSIGYCSREMATVLPQACKIRIHADDLFWKRYLEKKCPQMHKYVHSGLVVLNAGESKAFLSRDTNGITTNLDFFSSAFFIITGMEEIFNPHFRDEHDRFAFSLSRYAEAYVDQSLINNHAQTLRAWIEEVYDLRIPSNRQFTAVISHDIDIPYFYGTLRTELSELYNSIKVGGKYAHVSDLKHYLACLIGRQSDPHDTFSYIQGQEGKRGIAATYFIMLSRDNVWGLDRRKYSRTLKKIHAEGNEIALHPGFESYHDKELISQEKDMVESLSGATIYGVRNHFLRFRMPETYHVLSNRGLSYDATVGFPDREGFKTGICTPYKPFDIHRRERIEVIEIPLVVMDGTLRKYRKQSPQIAQSTIETLVEHVSSCGGVISFNWHNSFIIESNSDWRKVYEQSLDCLLNHGARFSTCWEVATRWLKYWN